MRSWSKKKKEVLPPIKNPLEDVAKLLPTLCPNTQRFKDQMTLLQQESQAIKKADSVLAELERRLGEQKSISVLYTKDVRGRSKIVEKTWKEIDSLFPGYVTSEEQPTKDTLDQRAKNLMAIRDKYAGIIARAAAALEDLNGSQTATEELLKAQDIEIDADLTRASNLRSEVSSLGKVSDAIVEKFGEIMSLASTVVQTPKEKEED
jgi:hypothetical protein